jgi:tripartite-type tricarboxylate transporter receptor subunit TctC
MKGIRRNIFEAMIMALLGAFALLAGPALAVDIDYPTKPVILTVGMAPGGAGSLSAQIFSDGVQKYLVKRQPFIINHKPGASGMVAGDYVMKQAADGYNLFWMTADNPLRWALEPHTLSFKKEDFTYIGGFAYSPFFLAVNSEGPFKTFEDFIDYSKKHPGEITISLTGIGAGNHLVTEILQRDSGIKLTQAPFPAGTQATLALMGGHVSCTIMSRGMFGDHIKPGGRIRGLVVFDTKRFPDLPEIPTCKEKGYDIVRYTYFALVAKKETPKPISEVLIKLFKQTASDPDVQSAMHKAGMVPWNLGPEELQNYVNKDYETANEVFEKLGLVKK